MHYYYCLLFCVLGGEPIPPASAEEKSSDGKPGEDEPTAVPGGQQVLPPRLQEHRWWVTDQSHFTTCCQLLLRWDITAPDVPLHLAPDVKAHQVPECSHCFPPYWIKLHNPQSCLDTSHTFEFMWCQFAAAFILYICDVWYTCSIKPVSLVWQLEELHTQCCQTAYEATDSVLFMLM